MKVRLILGVRPDDEANVMDPVRAYLKKRGAAQHVIEGGLEKLVRDWQQFVQSVSEGYSLESEDYLNDLDGRQLIEEALAVAPAAQKMSIMKSLRQADSALKRLTRPVETCLWGAENAVENGWTPKKNWWYFVVPRKGAADLITDLQRS
jgi:hypothetical protein